MSKKKDKIIQVNGQVLKKRAQEKGEDIVKKAKDVGSSAAKKVVKTTEKSSARVRNGILEKAICVTKKNLEFLEKLKGA